MRDVTTVTIRSHALLNRTLAVAVKLLRQNGIHPVLLKGQGVATNYIAPYLACAEILICISGKEITTRPVKSSGSGQGLKKV
ncbi:hypothetical protein OXV67_18735 [Bacteroides fragilis]|uniref:hypothetical protein n=1 Tax=Bacteroides hominis TaxID=2763023 RepID=UPI00227CF1B8|nr:hypothetical protein [Bacteroides fragilis]MCY6340786.1 hypothetical protein [Bacteroides fragilis]